MLGAMIGPASRRHQQRDARARARLQLAGVAARALLPTALALLPGAAAAAPPGRVVRVERTAIATVPRICVMLGGRGQSTCFGQTSVGEHVAFIDMVDRSVRGELVIEAVGPATEFDSLGLCVSSGAHGVRGTVTVRLDDSHQIVGLRGARLSPRISRVLTDVLPPSGRGEESVELAIDADGNGRADLVLTQYSCDATGALSASGEGRCLDTYLEQRGTLRRVQQDILRSCH
jgi:hypothetical protein